MTIYKTLQTKTIKTHTVKSHISTAFKSLMVFSALMGGTTLLAEKSALAVGPAAKTQVSAPVIAVVDLQSIFQSSKAAQDVREQIEARNKVYHDEITAEENKLKNLEQELARQRTVLSSDAFNKKREEFEAKYVELNKKFQNRKQILDTAFNEARDKLYQEIYTIIEAKAAEHKANIVLNRQQAIYVDDALNITDPVLAELDKKLPKIKVNLPKLNG